LRRRRHRGTQVVTGSLFQDEAPNLDPARADKPGVAAAIFGPLAGASLNVDICAELSADGATTDLTFTVPSADYERAGHHREGQELDRFRAARWRDDVARSRSSAWHAQPRRVAAQAFKALSDQKINIRHHTPNQFSAVDQGRQTDQRAHAILCTAWTSRTACAPGFWSDSA